MKTCVFGAGAIGGHLAVRLARAGCDTSVVARGAHLEAIRRDGLRLRAGGEETVTRPRASDRAADLGPQDVVLVTVKTTALAAIADDLTPLLGPDTAVVFVINGLPWWYLPEIAADPTVWSAPIADILAAMTRVVGRHRTVGGIAQSANHVPEPGVVFNSSPAANTFLFGAAGDAVGGRCDDLVAVLRADGFDARRQEPFVPAIWKKLMVNVITGPIGALTGMTSRALLRDPALRRTADALSAETEALAAACGVSGIAPDLAALAGTIADHKSSMLQDFELLRKPEIDTLLGTLCDIGRARGIATPALDQIHALARARAVTLGLLA